ncbi:DLA class II histocompatibility antigen, DR-1 beta chain-like [Elgaria multicarinata webbii]|uniref:DLA class II histocompatibility antigen, DR-1 beta chain-like n=1 Tax=Elgaria multicarinata webbii TaxID=159646 RepID=UPI002FCD42C8
MGSPSVPGDLLVLLVFLLVRPSLVHGMEGRDNLTVVHSWYQMKLECWQTKERPGTHFVFTFLVNGEEFVRYDSNEKKFVDVGEKSQNVSQDWNRQRALLRRKWVEWDDFCIHNGVFLTLISNRTRHLDVHGEAECNFPNRTRQAHYLERQNYNGEECVSFDNELGRFVAVTEQGEDIVRQWNSHEDYLKFWKTKVEDFCQHNYELLEAFFSPKGDEASEVRPLDFARSKMWTGIVGHVIGVVFVAMGLYFYLKTKQAAETLRHKAPQPEGLGGGGRTCSQFWLRGL